MFSDFFIERPVFSTVTSLFIVIAGAVCIPFLPVAQFPELAPPQIAVTSFYVGANATAVESSVTTLLEEAESTAEVAISSLRQNRPEAGPHVYQIRNKRGEIVFQSWEMAT